MGVTWEIVDADPPAEQYWPVPWVGATGQRKCGACGRFLPKTGRCSLVQMTYRDGSPYGFEHR